MTDNNIVSINGRLVREAVLSYSNGGTAILKFSIAVNRSVKKGDKWEDEASFFDCSYFGKMAESVNKYLEKGKQVSIVGELVQNRWENDGQKHSKVEIIVNKLQLLGSKDDKPEQQKADLPNTPENFVDDYGDFGIPF
jgi:single-strand DNA-binding protein